MSRYVQIRDLSVDAIRAYGGHIFAACVPSEVTTGGSRDLKMNAMGIWLLQMDSGDLNMFVFYKIWQYFLRTAGRIWEVAAAKLVSLIAQQMSAA